VWPQTRCWNSTRGWLTGIGWWRDQQTDDDAWLGERQRPPATEGWGDVWLARSNTVGGHLSGQVKFATASRPGPAKRVRLESVTPPGPVLHAVTDRSGGFELDLPAGTYRVAMDQRGVVSATKDTVVLSAGGRARVELTAPPLTGRVVAVGAGRVLRPGEATGAGPG